MSERAETSRRQQRLAEALKANLKRRKRGPAGADSRRDAAAEPAPAIGAHPTTKPE